MSCSGSPRAIPSRCRRRCTNAPRCRRSSASVAAGRKNGHVRSKAMQRAFRQVERDDAAAHPSFHDEIDHEILDEERRAIPDGLLVERVQHRMPGTVRCRAGALRNALPNVSSYRRTGADRCGPLRCARNGTPKCSSSMTAAGASLHMNSMASWSPNQSEPLTVSYMWPAPIILAHVAERRADAALRGHRMTACRKELGDARRGKPRLREPQGGAQSCASRTDYDHVVAVVDPLSAAHQRPPEAIFTTASTAALRHHVREVDADERQSLKAGRVHIVLDDYAQAQLASGARRRARRG